ncbi:MAG TPA: hypothetical protein VK988_06520 [Acidimicrobiales bacterium]|nr:hypothetical protein [Acidimicrobiales bacterium]
MANVQIHRIEALRKGRPLVELAPGVRIPSRFSGDVQGDEFPYDIALEVVFEGCRFVCEALRCQRKPGGPLVKSEFIRKLPVAELIRLLAGEHLWKVNECSPGELVVEPFNLPEPRTEEGPTKGVLADVAVHLDPRGAELSLQTLTEREERTSVAVASRATFTDPRLAAAAHRPPHLPGPHHRDRHPVLSPPTDSRSEQGSRLCQLTVANA